MSSGNWGPFCLGLNVLSGNENHIVPIALDIRALFCRCNILEIKLEAINASLQKMYQVTTQLHFHDSNIKTDMEHESPKLLHLIKTARF